MNRFQFSAESNLQPHAAVEPWDEILFESTNFVAIPTRGCLVEGWLLIVPRVHHFCVGGFSREMLVEFQLFRNEVQKGLELVYGQVVAFEHGPANSGRAAGCGVDHAHLHLVPWAGLFADAIQSHSVCDFTWSRVDGFNALPEIHATDRDYLFFQESDGSAYVAASDAIPSQFFRRIVASALGFPHLSDWKRHGGVESVRATVAALRKNSLASALV